MREQEYQLGLVYSASQIDTADRCLRKWGWDKLAKIPRKESKATRLGSEVHAQLESYLKTGYMDLTTTAGKIAVVGLHLNPPPGFPHMKVEGHFELRIGIHLFQGYKDVEILYPGLVPYAQDHKSTKSFFYKKEPEDLVNDVQACLYALDSMVKASAEWCDLRWIYYKTQGAKEAVLTHTRVHLNQILPTIDRIVRTADTLRAIRLHHSPVHPKQLPPNVAACGDFGGCPYLDLCDDLGSTRYL